MKHLSRVAIILAISVMSVVALAQSAVGSWNGKMDLSAVKANSPKEQSGIDMMKKMLGNATFKLVFKNDKTFSITTSGFGGGKSQTESGKWSQSGKVVTVTDPKGKAEKMNMSADGKTMTMTPSTGNGAPKGLKVVFKRG